jgi:hypothetical protein
MGVFIKSEKMGTAMNNKSGRERICQRPSLIQLAVESRRLGYRRVVERRDRTAMFSAEEKLHSSVDGKPNPEIQAVFS